MTERERLIELLFECVDGNKEAIKRSIYGPLTSKIADHLLLYGVIVPPCKVGDMVYEIYNNKVIKGKAECVEVVVEENCTQYIAGVRFFDHISMIKGFAFGETVFLTKEEAEKALAERV